MNLENKFQILVDRFVHRKYVRAFKAQKEINDNSWILWDKLAKKVVRRAILGNYIDESKIS